MKKVTVDVTYSYELEIDEENEIVKEYDTQEELLQDCATYRFGTGLPVIGEGGVKIKTLN